MQAEAIELVGNEMRRAGHEAGANTECLGAKPQIEARRLDLVAIQRALGDRDAPFQTAQQWRGRQEFLYREPSCPIQFAADKTKLGELTQALSAVLQLYPVVIWPVGLQPR
jgi:hypothetical protein